MISNYYYYFFGFYGFEIWFYTIFLNSVESLTSTRDKIIS